MKLLPKLLFGTLLAFLLSDLALANKFETIGSGVSGSFRLKAEFMRGAFLTGGIIFALSAVLAVVVPRTNAAYLNFANWKMSAIVLSLLSAAMFLCYFLY